MKAASATSDRRVLVVDDEPGMVRLLKANLEHIGIEVETARDGVEALEKIARQRFDLVLLDVMMPRMDGFQVLKTVRTNPETENLFVVMLTAKVQDKDVFDAYHYGADMYLAKPFNMKEVLNLFWRG